MLLGRLAGRGGLLRGQIRASSRRSWTHISPISIHEGPIIEKKGLRGWSPRRSHLSALWFRCLGVPREAMNFSSSLVRMRGRARVVLPCVRDEGRAMRLISSILGQGAEVAEWEELSNEREVGERVRRPMEVGERACRLTGAETSDPPGEKAGSSKRPRLSKKLKLGLAPTDEMGIILSCAFEKSATDWQIPR